MKTLPVYNHPELSVLVSDEDYEALRQHRWVYNKGYVRRWTGGGWIQIAWDVALRMGLPACPEHDHLDRNPLNNTRENIRVSTRSENNSNRLVIPFAIKPYVTST